MEDIRPNPDELLKQISQSENRQGHGNFRLFFGMAAGVGKTYAMLKAAGERLKEGVDVVIGIVETHGRPETEKLLLGIPIIPRKRIEYRGTIQEEMDLDTILAKRPALVLVDELAHTNVAGGRHDKRYQDVIDLLEAGIDVYSTMNVQHLESRADIVQLITAVTVRETVPDSVLDLVDQIDLIDIPPADLIERLKEGKVYPGRMTKNALQYFFQEGNLTALREIALRVTADKVERSMRGRSSGAVLPVSREASKLLVAVSHSPFSEKLIRTARRLVDDMEIPWVAVHVDTGIILNKTDQNQLVKNLSLAEEMGAEIMTLHGADVAKVIGDFAGEHNVVQIVIGRPGVRRRWWSIRRPSRIILRLIENNPNIDLTVVQQPNIRGRRNSDFSANFKYEFRPKTYLVSVGFVMLAGLVNYYINPYIGYRAVGFTFLLLIIVLGLTLPFTAVFMAAALSALIWNYYFIPPKGTFSISSPEDMMMFLTYFIIALASGFLTAQIRRHQNILREREKKTSALYEILRAMTLAQGAERVIELSISKLEALFDAECGIVLAHNGDISSKLDFGHFELTEKDLAVAMWSYNHGRMAGWSTNTLSLSGVLCLALKASDERFGVLVFKPKVDKKLNPDQENMLISIVNQIGIVLAKRKYDEDSKQSRLLQESEKLHQILLSCISHELRTPLTSIVGAATALQAQRPGVDGSAGSVILLEEIVSASERLNHVFENLLDMTRLESGVIKLNKEWFELSELVSFAVERQKKQLINHRVELKIQQGVYCLGDYNLLEHAISNLLLNAATYSSAQSTVTVVAALRSSEVVIDIVDQGPGIPENAIPHLFEKFYRLPASPSGGLGLGLSITKNIMELHGGNIRVKNVPDGGAAFTIMMPYIGMPDHIQEAIS